MGCSCVLQLSLLARLLKFGLLLTAEAWRPLAATSCGTKPDMCFNCAATAPQLRPNCVTAVPGLCSGCVSPLSGLCPNCFGTACQLCPGSCHSVTILLGLCTNCVPNLFELCPIGVRTVFEHTWNTIGTQLGHSPEADCKRKRDSAQKQL